MATVRTLTFLPEIFQTPTNAEFLSATLDQIVNPPVTTRIQGYVGSKFGYGVNAKDYYVTEPTKVRTDYQLDPGVVFTKTDESVAKDFITYPGMLDALAMQGGITNNNSRLFQSQFYSWDSFTSLDKLINFNEYYWLPTGPPAVTISAARVFTIENFIVNSLPNAYSITPAGSNATSHNPTITLLRGGIYTFAVSQDSQFWIQTFPGVSGTNPTQPNIPTREVYGVTNNGTNAGVVTFVVPQADAQDQYIFPGNNQVDLVSTVPFGNINGALLSDVVNIDGVTALDGLTVMFYNTGVPDEIGYVSSYFDEVSYDVDDPAISNPVTTAIVASTDSISNALTLDAGYTTADLYVNQTITFSNPIYGNIVAGQLYFITSILNSTDFIISETLGGATVVLTDGSGSMTMNIGQGLYEQGFYTPVSANFYRITYVGDPSNPVIRLLPNGSIPNQERIIPSYGNMWINRGFYRNTVGVISLIPQITAPLDTLYYQDGTSPNKVGTIRLIESNISNTINVETTILGKPNYTSTSGVVFTNGLKVTFDGDIIPASYLQGEYYVEGVGTAIELVPAESLVCPEGFTQGEYIPWDTAGFDVGNFDIDLFIPIEPDYITVARNSISKNAWSRSNRWFHIDVINATATYNNNSSIVELAQSANKAKRPIIEFYPNLKLFNSGTLGKAAVDFFDTRTTDALSTVPMSRAFYPDVETYTAYSAIIAPVFSATSTTVTIDAADVTGAFQIGMYVGDTNSVLPTNAQITDITGTTTLILTIGWEVAQDVLGVTDASVVGTDTTVDNYALFPGARIIFSADTDINVRNKIYVANLVRLTPTSAPTITLELAEDGEVLPDEQTVILRGYNYQGLSFHYDGDSWINAQQKITVNQAPLFDIFDANGISFGDTAIYNSSSFVGNKLFAYGIGTGLDDSILGFPIRYSSIDNVGDISFDISLNLDTFEYVTSADSVVQKVNTGYVYDYTSRTSHVRQLGWQTAVAPSGQYQAFSFDFSPGTASTFTCDIAILPELAENEKGWARVQVFNNNEYVEPGDYTVTVTGTTTKITLTTAPVVSTVIQIMLLSDQVSSVAFYVIPTNLNSNPFNEDLTSVNVGDIRSQYRDIFINAPNTTGKIFGSNNYRDCGDLISYGTKIIQNSASLVLPGTFFRNPDHNLFNALLFNSREYIKYKQLLVDTVQNTDYTQRYLPSQILDLALTKIAASKSQSNAFFWSDMVPGKAPYRSNTYNFANGLDVTIYPLSHVYNFSTANYDGVLVYVSRSYGGNVAQKQLTRGVDYIVSTDSPSLTVTLDLVAGDQVTINEYNQTYGSYVPNTPTKLGMYPAFEPAVVLDSDYMNPTYFIKGHDGSYTKLYGDYYPETGILVDFRDQALLEFETRIYNNIKLSTRVPIEVYEVVPGYFRDSTFSQSEWLQIYSTTFLDWVGQNRLDYKTQFYNKNNEYTYNYTNSGNRLDNAPIEQGYWRGVYQYFYDTTAPNLTPWEMLAFANEPTWWTDRYGPAPYTSDNGILWGDLELGLIWNNGDPFIVPELARPGLSRIIPVDSNGDLVSPLYSVVGNYNPSTFQKDWKVGDDGPVELSYRRSSSYPFDLMRIFALTRPAEFFNLGVDLDKYQYNTEFNQYLVDDRHHLVISDIEIYGNGIAKTSYINWIVDYEKQQGIDATTNIKSLFNNLDVRLIYRLAGYSDQTLLNFFVEKSSPNSRNASLLIPNESYSILLYDNQPYDRLNFSGVIVQQTPDGWTVYGNSQNVAYFTTLAPKFAGKFDNITVEDISVKLSVDFYNTEVNIPYGTKFYSPQELSQFLANYGAWLVSKGMIFDEVVNGIEFNWQLMIQEFLYWIQTGWQEGSVITLNPAATVLKVNKDSQIVQPLTFQQQNFILNQDSYPIQLNTLAIQRDNTLFAVRTLNQGDSMSYAQFSMSNFEHGIVFNNITLFNDVIYNLITGLRQNRIAVRGTKSAEWNGTMNASGFVLSQDNINEWSKAIKYTKGEIVKFKNKYWAALQIIEPAVVFEERQWKRVNYNNIQLGMLPNASTRAFESTLFYDTNKANLDQDANLLSYSLIGYRPRDYLALVNLTDITQINVYQNMIRNKGTRNATLAFKGANLPQGGIDYDIYENWAIKSGEFGGILNENFVEFRINQVNMTGNPSIVSLTNGVPTPGTMQEIPLYSLFNYGRVVDSPDILSTIDYVPVSPLYPNAGYVNFNDIKMSSFYFAGLPGAVDKAGAIVPIDSFYAREYLWMANFKDKWGVYTFKPLGQVIQVRGLLNGTATVTFNKPHNLSNLDPVAIINFAPGIDGYYIVVDVVNINQVTLNLTIPNNSSGTVNGLGIGLAFETQRVATPGEILGLDLLDAEYVKNTVWVDENTDGNWAVYRKSINYTNSATLTAPNSTTLGSAVAYDPTLGYFVGDASAGVVYRWFYNTASSGYDLIQTFTNDVSFGSKIVYAQNVCVISEPTSGTPKVYIYVLNDTVLTDQLQTYQTEIGAPIGVTNWGSELAISGDANWIYISDVGNAQIYVYRKNNINLTAGYFVSGQTYTITSVGDTDFTAIGAIENAVGIAFVATGVGSGTGTATQITYEYSSVIDGTIAGASGSDGFSSSLATNNDGDIIVVGAPNTTYDNTQLNVGTVFIYQRTQQNIESQITSIPNNPQILQLAWTPDQVSGITSDEVNANYIHCSVDMTGFAVNDPVIFTGLVFGDCGVHANAVYYIHSIGGGGPSPTNRNIKIKSSRSSSTAVTLTNDTGLSFNVSVQTTPLYVSVNGTLIDDSNYGIVGNTLLYTAALKAGDIVSVNDSQFNDVQTLSSDNKSRSNIYYGYALDVSNFGTELLVGSPYEIDSKNREGIVYRYTNSGAKYGVIIGENECNVLGNRQVLLNGYLVSLSAGNAESVANTINASRITNIQASSTYDNKLIIQLVDSTLAEINEKLMVSVFQPSVLNELGIQIYTETQVINCPHETGPTQFGKAIKFNEYDSVVISAPVGTRYEGTTFDFSDDENLDNDTVFDNNSTRWIDSCPNAGAVYMFDYLSQYNESLLNTGAFVYAQSVNSNQQDYGNQPLYGASIDFNNNSVIVGSPDFFQTTIGGEVVIFNNDAGVRDWSIFRQSAPIVDISRIQNSQIFSAETNNTLINLDYMDPLQNKLLGAVRENIDYVSSVDPGRYNSITPNGAITEPSSNVWGAEHVGRIWFNTSGVRWVNYHQDDAAYNSQYWGALFPGSNVAVSTWVASNVPPSQYTGPGVPLDINSYAVSSALNASNIVVPVYYFWAINTSIISEKLGKTLSDSTIATYIVSPRTSGISYMAPLLPNAFAIYNSYEYFNANDSVFHIGYANGTTDDVAHNEFTLIRQNYADDFLPGLPKAPEATHGLSEHGAYPIYSLLTPNNLYARLLDSLSGCDQSGAVVPNPFLPRAVQSGVLTRPRQSFFFNRFEAVKNYLTYANDVLAQYPITEIRPDATFLFASGTFYDTKDYWEYVNWWAVGYDNSSKSTVQVPIYADLATLNVEVNSLVTVEMNGAGKFEVYRYDGAGVWTRIGLEDGTIQFKPYLWDYSAAKLGFGGDFFDTKSYDVFPSEETYNIVRALSEQIYIGDLLTFRNKSLIILFEYIQSETTESQNFLPWLNKTSIIEVDHTIRELLPYEVYKTDNQEFLSGYINEVKPYHVVINQFVFKYTGSENYDGAFTDFDLPATYDSTVNQFISPQLVYGEPENEYEFSADNAIWTTSPYVEWFNNHGVAITGQDNYNITVLTSYLSLAVRYIVVDNAQGFPINGTIRIGEEYISYAYVDRALNLLGGIVRGINNTTVVDHIPGETIYIDLPAVLVLDGGGGYTEPPRVTAYIDTSIYPEPTVPAQFEAIMALDTVISVNVIDPGKGYAVLPEIIIDPATVIYFSDTAINSVLHTIKLYAPSLSTGTLVQFRQGSGASVGKLVNKQWYYVNVLENTPTVIVALYSSYGDALKDHDRVLITNIGASSDLALAIGAKASAITSASPVRENNITIKFDRTSYTSQVIDWQEGEFYGSYFAGSYVLGFNTPGNAKVRLSGTSVLNPSGTSSSLQLEDSLIDSVLASSSGAAFEIVDVENDQQVSWSSFVRYVSSTTTATNSIRLIPQDNNNDPLNPEPNASGTTIGFYTNMPIKFIGAVVGGLVNDTVYYVKEVLNDLDFTISETVDGVVKTLTTGNVNLQGLQCYTAEVINTAIITVNYPGILNVTATTAVTNALTVPLSDIGTGGTFGFYTNIPVFFDGNVFGGVVANQNYYVTTVIDEQTFTISEKQNPLSVTVSESVASTDTVVVSSTEGFVINYPIIFTDLLDAAGDPLSTFGNIVAGTTYYVSEVVSDTEMTISIRINGAVFALSDQLGTAALTSQQDTLSLTTVTGSMTMNVSLPVSPGQVNKQLFTLYNTSGQYPGIDSGTIGNGIERVITATIGDGTLSGVNRVALSQEEAGTAFFYTNMPIRVNTNIGGLTTATTYYVLEYSGMADPLNPGEYLTDIQVTVTTTSSSGNYLYCDTTDSLYIGMQIIFSGVGLGGIVISKPYFVKTIDSGTSFTISEISGGAVKILATDNGIMVGTGDAYITVSTSIGGAVVTLTTDTVESSFTQFVTGVPTFTMSYMMGGYRALITAAGSGFAINNTITIAGTAVGGVSPGNDITLTVNTISSTGQITDVIRAGTVPDIAEQYYLQVISSNKLAVFANPLLTVPVSGIDFSYVGFTSANVTNINSGADSLTIADTSIFSLYDAVVFTGNTSESITNLVLGNTYYVLEILSGTTFTVSTIPADAATKVNMVTTVAVNFTVSKAGSYAVLPEPFYFNQSIVKFNGRVYVCMISNNDSEFVFGKWELLDSGDRRLNALDRIVGYYKPNKSNTEAWNQYINMPGDDLTQLVSGITYPNSTYKGNAFQPDQQFQLDTVLRDQAFSPTGVNSESILWNGAAYIAVANFPSYSATLLSMTGESWDIKKLTNSVVGVTDIYHSGSLYAMTSTNTTTPVFRSVNGVEWTASEFFVPYASFPHHANPHDITTAGMTLNAVTCFNGFWIAVGNMIVLSTETNLWFERTQFNPNLDYQLYGVAPAAITAFSGLIAVGKGKRYDYSTEITQIVDTNLILYGPNNGTYWIEVDSITPKGLYGVSSDSTAAIAVGESGVIYYTLNGANWLGLNEVTVISVNGATNELNITNTVGFNVNDTVRFSASFSSIIAGTTYYIKTVVSSTQVELSATSGGSIIALSASTIAAQTMMYSYDAADATPATLRDIIYANSTWITVGDAGVIKTSPDGIVWTKQTSGTIQNLKGITYNSSAVSFTVVGDNNTIITSQDDGVTWTSTSAFTIVPTVYDVQGAEFQFGYGPEELVPGIVTDNLTMIVTTSAGTTWPVTEYGHTGFRTASIVIEPTSELQTDYSFAALVENPAQITVQVLDATSGLGTTLSTSAYTIDWINKVVTLVTPILYSPDQQSIRIDAYEVGNGDQIVKASTDYTPFRTDSTTGFNEVYLSCNYSAAIYQGSGVIRTGSNYVVVRAFQTEAASNKIYCDDVSQFVINNVVTFQGVTFGNIEELTDYYVKSISYATNSITISASINPTTGIAGPTFILTDDTGEMYVNVQSGNPTVWTDPVVYHNGVKLVAGTTGFVTKSTASDNALTTTTTAGLILDTPIVFSNTMFGPDIEPMTVYYIASKIDANSFTISATQGGPILTLSDSTGGATFITSDFSFAQQPNGISAKMIFSTDVYANSTDYIVYSIFGETQPQQYGYSIPQIQEFVGDGAINQFELDNYVGDINPNNAIVEINGVRQTISQYVISSLDNNITFVNSPANGATISVLTYNDTRRQYLTSQYNITGNPGSSLIALTIGSTTNLVGTYDQDAPVVQTFDEDVPEIVVFDQDLNWLTLSSGDTSSLTVNDTIIFDAPTLGGLIAGEEYYVIQILNSTEFVVSETVGGPAVELYNDTGSMTASANGLTVAGITNITNAISPPLATTFATSSTAGSPNQISVLSTENFVLDQPVQFFGTSFDANILTDGTVYFVDTIVDSSTFTIKDENDIVIVTAGGTGDIKAVVGGNPAIRITTAIEHHFVENTLVKLDGITGSVQLNDNSYYAKIISNYQFDLYTQPYNPAVSAVNYPVTDVSTYTGDGYAWREGLFFIVTTHATATSSANNRITVDSTLDLVPGTPVYFSQIETVNGTALIGGLIQAQVYYVKDIHTGTEFTVSETREGSTVVLTNGTGAINVTQWAEENVDRLWVTVNGLRVPSAKLRVNPANEVSILTQIVPGDQVIITNMIPTATPNQEIYMNSVDAIGQPSVYRVSNPITTWLTQPVYDLSTVIYVYDVTKLAREVVQNATVPAAVNNYYYIGIAADKNIISGVKVYNNTTSSYINSANYQVVIVDLTPTLRITAGSYISVSDSLTITTLEGNTMYVNGEQIRFGTVDFDANTVGQLQRGVNGTARQNVIPTYSVAYGLLSVNQLPDIYYNQTWNSNFWNTTLGDPLQISITSPAEFLNSDVSQ